MSMTSERSGLDRGSTPGHYPHYPYGGGWGGHLTIMLLPLFTTEKEREKE